MTRVRGFTLVELLVTVMILGIIAAFAAPSFNGVIRSARTDSNFSELKTGFNYARSEAATQQQGVSICTSNDAATCTGNTDWQAGWLVFSDADQDGVFDDDGDANLCEAAEDDDCVLRVWDGLANGFTLTEADDKTVVTFVEDGAIEAAADMITLTLAPTNCPSGDSLLRVLSISNLIGRINTTVGNCP